MQRLYDQAVQGRGLVPDFGEAAPVCTRPFYVDRPVLAGGSVTEGAGTMSQDQTQVRVEARGGGDLRRQFGQLVQSRSIGARLVGDQRSAELQEGELRHAQNCSTFYGCRQEGLCYNGSSRLP